VSACLYDAVVVHQRTRPVPHRLRYRVATLLLDLDELPALASRLRLFSHNRANLVSFHDRDHGDGGALRAWVEAQLDAAGIARDGGAIRLLCMPRVLGHVFNPISVFFCHRRDGALAAVLYEVNNTFGQRHCYLIAVADDARPLRQSCAKSFYVSPFLPMRLTYSFRVEPPDAAVSIGVVASDADGVLLAARLDGRRRRLTDLALLGAVLRMQLLGLKVVAGIHWEALKLWCKGVRLQPRPAPPAHPVTLGR
jgi:DUF1365 family protein